MSFWRISAGRFILSTISGAVRHQPNNELNRTGPEPVSALNFLLGENISYRFNISFFTFKIKSVFIKSNAFFLPSDESCIQLLPRHRPKIQFIL